MPIKLYCIYQKSPKRDRELKELGKIYAKKQFQNQQKPMVRNGLITKYRVMKKSFGKLSCLYGSFRELITGRLAAT